MVMFLAFTALCVVLLPVLFYLFLRRKVTAHLPSTFPISENRSKIDATKKVVVCFGDSNTHGNVSHDWVADLQVQNTDYQFINAGRNSDLTFTLLHRIGDVIACKPDYITLLIGTNDINATLAKSSLKRYYQTGRIQKNEVPSLATFSKNYAAIISKLTTETSAKIAVISLPLMGEDLTNESNKKVQEYNAAIKTIADENRLTYLPLFETQQDYIRQHPSTTKYVFKDYFSLLNKSVLLHFILGKSWDEISEKHGTRLSPDFLHQNSVAGGMIAKLVNDFLVK